MVTSAQIKKFLDAKEIAVAGASAKSLKFGNSIIKEFLQKGYTIHPIHPSASEIENLKTVSSCTKLPGDVKALFIALNKQKTVDAVRDAMSANIDQIWIQQGSESDEAISLCNNKGVSVIHGYCPLMFAEPAAFGHRLHRFFVKMFGKLPS